jgi:membrane-associated phospholipid phosphatase
MHEEAVSLRWSMVAESLTRPYRVTVPMVLMVSLVPFYIFIAELMPGRAVHAPALALDGALPLLPAWAQVYGCLYLFLILLPVFVVRQQEQIRRTVWAYLTIWLTAYACFLLYPTIGPRPVKVMGSGFIAWGLRSLYDFDPPYNCFPSLHVAHSFVSALACMRVHRRLGIVATVFAALVGLSTLFTKQHYILDVGAGILLAFIAYLIFLRGDRDDHVPETDRHIAPLLAVGVAGIVGVAFLCFLVAYEVS